MGQDWEAREEFELDATPEQVWEAIATGPGIDSWYMGRTEVEPGEGGRVRTTLGEHVMESTVTAWEPQRRLAYRLDEGGDGRFVAYEFLIEGREDGSTVLRVVLSGFIPGDDWADEYEAIGKGTGMYLRTLGAYLAHFPGRTATPVTAYRPVTDWGSARVILTSARCLADPVAVGDPVRAYPPGLAPIVGVVDDADGIDVLGVRTPDALYRFLRGFRAGIVVGHHIFADVDVDAEAVGRAWQAWLDELFA